MAKKVMKKYQNGGGINKMNPSKGPVKPGSREAFDKIKTGPIPKSAFEPMKPVRPPKSTRKAGPSTPASIMKGMRKGGSMRGQAC